MNGSCGGLYQARSKGAHALGPRNHAGRKRRPHTSTPKWCSGLLGVHPDYVFEKPYRRQARLRTPYRCGDVFNLQGGVEP